MNILSQYRGTCNRSIPPEMQAMSQTASPAVSLVVAWSAALTAATVCTVVTPTVTPGSAGTVAPPSSGVPVVNTVGPTAQVSGNTFARRRLPSCRGPPPNARHRQV